MLHVHVMWLRSTLMPKVVQKSYSKYPNNHIFPHAPFSISWNLFSTGIQTKFLELYSKWDRVGAGLSCFIKRNYYRGFLLNTLEKPESIDWNQYVARIYKHMVSGKILWFLKSFLEYHQYNCYFHCIN